MNKRLDEIAARVKRWQSELPLLIQPEREHVQNIADITLLLEIVRTQGEALEFYANPEIYILRRKDDWLERTPPADKEMIRDYAHPGVDWRGTVTVGGARSRKALAKVAELCEGEK